MAEAQERFIYEVVTRGFEEAVAQMRQLANAVAAVERATGRMAARTERLTSTLNAFNASARVASGAMDVIARSASGLESAARQIQETTTATRAMSRAAGDSARPINRLADAYRHLADSMHAVGAAPQPDVPPAPPDVGGSGRGGGGGGSADDKPLWYHLPRPVRHGIIIAEAILLYQTYEAIVEAAQRWYQVQRDLDMAIARFRVLVAATADELKRYNQEVTALSYATGTPRAEVMETATIAARLRQPELTRLSTEFEMIFGVQSTRAARELYALTRQFPDMSARQLADLILRIARHTALSADEILSLSETWGAFARQLNMDVTEISGLFSALGTVLGETGNSIETFMRHLERFYTDEALAQLYYQYTGKPTISYTPTGEQIRRPMIEILSDVAAMTYAQQRAIAEFMPQELGQKSRQYFDQMIAQWETIVRIQDELANDTYTMRDAANAITNTLDRARRRLDVAWDNYLAALGEAAGMIEFFNRTAAQFQLVAMTNQFQRTVPTGWRPAAGWSYPAGNQSLITDVAARRGVQDAILQALTPPQPNVPFFLQNTVNPMLRLVGRGLAEMQYLQWRSQYEPLIARLANFIALPPQIQPENAQAVEEYARALVEEAVQRGILNLSDPEPTPEMIEAFVEYMYKYGEDIAKAIAAPHQLITPMGPQMTPLQQFMTPLSKQAAQRIREEMTPYLYAYGRTESVAIPGALSVQQLQDAVNEAAKRIAASVNEYNESLRDSAGNLRDGAVALADNQTKTVLVLDEITLELKGVVSGPAYALEAALNQLTKDVSAASDVFKRFAEIELPLYGSINAFKGVYQQELARMQELAQQLGVAFEPQATNIVLRAGGRYHVLPGMDPEIAQRAAKLYAAQTPFVVPAGTNLMYMRDQIAEEENRLRSNIENYNRMIERAAAAMGHEPDLIALDTSVRETRLVIDNFGRVIGVVTGSAALLETAFRNAADRLTTMLEMPIFALPEGADVQTLMSYYDKAKQRLQALATEAYPVGEEYQRPVLVLSDVGEPLQVIMADQRLLSIASQMLRSGLRTESNTRRTADILGEIIRAIPGVRQPTPVTALELYYQRPLGLYRDKFDEAVRRARADIEHMVAGRPLEYGLGTAIAPDIFTPEIMAFARGLPTDQMAQVLRDLLSEYERQFYGGLRPPQEYSKEIFLAEARRIIAERSAAEANEQMYRQWLVEAGLAQYAQTVLAAVQQPPLLRALTGDKTPEEMRGALAEYTKIEPALSTDALVNGFQKAVQQTDWGAILNQALSQSVAARQQDFVVTGQLMGKYLASGISDTILSLLISEVYNRLVKELSR